METSARKAELPVSPSTTSSTSPSPSSNAVGKSHDGEVLKDMDVEESYEVAEMRRLISGASGGSSVIAPPPSSQGGRSTATVESVKSSSSSLRGASSAFSPFGSNLGPLSGSGGGGGSGSGNGGGRALQMAKVAYATLVAMASKLKREVENPNRQEAVIRTIKRLLRTEWKFFTVVLVLLTFVGMRYASPHHQHLRVPTPDVLQQTIPNTNAVPSAMDGFVTANNNNNNNTNTGAATAPTTTTMTMTNSANDVQPQTGTLQTATPLEVQSQQQQQQQQPPPPPAATWMDLAADVQDLRRGLKQPGVQGERGTVGDIPLFFHIPRSGGSTTKDILGGCFRFVVASEVGGRAPDGQGQKLPVNKKLEVIQPGGANGASYVNVDTTSLDGIENAKTRGLVASGLSDVIVTQYLHDALQLFDPQNPNQRARVFMLLRHPIERAVSLFHYLGVAHWERTYDPDLRYVPIEMYARSPRAEYNWMVRYLANERHHDLTREHLELAKEILRRKVIVGFLEDKEETFRRFGKYFGWWNGLSSRPGIPQQQQAEEAARQCQYKLLQLEWPNRNPHPLVQPGTEAWDLLLERNSLDMELYTFARQLYDEQSILFADPPPEQAPPPQQQPAAPQ